MHCARDEDDCADFVLSLPAWKSQAPRQWSIETLRLKSVTGSVVILSSFVEHENASSCQWPRIEVKTGLRSGSESLDGGEDDMDGHGSRGQGVSSQSLDRARLPKLLDCNSLEGRPEGFSAPDFLSPGLNILWGHRHVMSLSFVQCQYTLTK